MDRTRKTELQDLLSALCDDCLSPEEGLRLASLLRDSEEARLLYVCYIDQHASLGHAALVSEAACNFEKTYLGEALDAARWNVVGRTAQSTVQNKGKERSRGWSLSGFVGASSLVLLAGVGSWWLARVSAPAPSRLGEIVAEITGGVDCTWQGADEPLVQGTRLRAGQHLSLVSGKAKLRFDSQTVVLAESPTTFELLSDTSLRLLSGTIVLQANGPQKDFKVLAANASIVDLGTSFGVHSGPDGLDIEVFEGKVEVLPNNDVRRSQVLTLGATARVQESGGEADITLFENDEGRFTDLLQMLWEDVQSRSGGPSRGDGPTADAVFPRAEFNIDDASSPIDRFHGAIAGKGWITPWLASGKPIGEIASGALVAQGDNHYLSLSFFRSSFRTIAREYGATPAFDPAKPHVVSWVWRFDGQDEDFGDSFLDRAAFYGNSYFRANSSPDITWFIGWNGDHERVGPQRRTKPQRWFVLRGKNGSEYAPANLVDTGMELKPGVVYRMAVVVYPTSKLYDAIIQDDEQTFFKTRLGFRNPSPSGGHVVHFSVGCDPPMGDACFSLDSVRIEPLRPELIPHDLRFNVPDYASSAEAVTDNAAVAPAK
ncbi:MAG: FecR domain-containing protein [Planctomycetales bacterium]|nr:FecR domain-containing protein [Planctomycetales bacterium]